MIDTPTNKEEVHIPKQIELLVACLALEASTCICQTHLPPYGHDDDCEEWKARKKISEALKRYSEPYTGR